MPSKSTSPVNDVTWPQQGEPRGQHMLVIVLFALFVGLSGIFALPPLDRDESRFIQATTQMLETGDYITIRYQDDERNKKPAGIYWLQAASVSLVSDVEKREVWAYRLPSLLSAALAAVAIYWLGCTLFSPTIGFWAALLLTAAPVFAGEATIAKTDATLLLTVCIAQAALAALFARHKRTPDISPPRWLAVLFWAALGFGMLIKGPITPMISFLTIAGLIFTGQVQWRAFFKNLHLVTGFIVLTLMVVPWAVAIGVATEGRFFTEAIGTDMLGKLSQGQEKHGGPPGYHLLFLWFMFLPAALFIPRAFVNSLKSFRQPAMAFCLSWLIPGWIVFEATTTKLAHYTLPLYPALALLVVSLVINKDGERSSLLSKLPGAALFLIASGTLAALMVLMPAEYRSAGIAPYHWVFAGVVASFALATFWFYFRDHLKTALLTTIMSSALTLWMLFDGVLTQADALHLSPRLAQTLSASELHPLRDHTSPVALVGYHEPSAVFLLGTDTILTDASGAADWLASQPGHVAVIETRLLPDFLNAASEIDKTQLAVLDGFNYSNGKKMTLTIFQSVSAATN